MAARVVEKNQEAIPAHVLKIEREVVRPEAFVRVLTDIVDRKEPRNGKGMPGR